jgi:hypothetical protein
VLVGSRQQISVLRRIADSSRTLHHVRGWPKSDTLHIATKFIRSDDKLPQAAVGG